MQVRDMWAPTTGNPNIQATSGSKLKGFAVHQTANLNRGADADAHGRLQKNINVRVASWHETVDDREAVRSFRKEVRCWHAGSGALDYYAIEICVNVDGDYTTAVRNATRRIATVHVTEGIPLVLKDHNAFTGKNCPTQLRAGKNGITWAAFIAMVHQEVAALRGTGAVTTTPAPITPTTPAPAAKSVQELAAEVLRGLHGTGEARKQSLGAQYTAVQAEVNRQLLGGPSKVPATAPAPKPAMPTVTAKTVSQMATEVLAGKHGNGHATRRASLGVNAATYEAVRAEVNRRARK